MKVSILALLVSFILTSCSKESSSSGVKERFGKIKVSLSENETEAKGAIESDMQSLHTKQYQIEDEEIQTLVDEELLSEDELKARAFKGYERTS